MPRTKRDVIVTLCLSLASFSYFFPFPPILFNGCQSLGVSAGSAARQSIPKDYKSRWRTQRLDMYHVLFKLVCTLCI